MDETTSPITWKYETTSPITRPITRLDGNMKKVFIIAEAGVNHNGNLQALATLPET
jgi:hypothetical protein